MNGLILVRILTRVGVLDHPAHRLCFQNDPGPIALLEIVGDLHACSLRGPGLGPEFDVGVRLIPVDGNTADIHVHGAHVKRADSSEVLQDAGANGVLVARLLFASAGGNERGRKPQGQCPTLHEDVLSSSIEFVFHRGGLQPIAHEEGDPNVNSGKDGEGITKRPVNDVPEIEDLLSA